MSRVAIICVLVVFVGLALADEKYSDKYDNVDVDAILNNESLLSKYIKCLDDDNDDSECTENAKAFKGRLAESLATDCAKCTDTQKIKIEKIVRFFYKNHREVLEKLQKKYDPSGSYLTKHPDYKE